MTLRVRLDDGRDLGVRLPGPHPRRALHRAQTTAESSGAKWGPFGPAKRPGFPEDRRPSISQTAFAVRERIVVTF
jgi:hypothetical protein